MHKTNERLSNYPEVIVNPSLPYCDCRQKEFDEYGGFCVGPSYCPKHNVIIVENLFMFKDETKEFEEMIEIINHETIHWILCKEFSESVSLKFDDVLEEKKYSLYIQSIPAPHFLCLKN